MAFSHPSEPKMRSSSSHFHVLCKFIIFRSIRTLTDRMLGIYRPDSPKWDNISSLAETFGLSKVVNSTAVDFFASQGVSETYIFEVIQAATRVNYGQNTDEINGLTGALSMASSGASDIEGGNYQIFEQFVNRSGATIYLNTKVSISRYSGLSP
jgi:prenylcysteine oxidase/farnesylcysteine lyase